MARGYASTPPRCLLCGAEHWGVDHVWAEKSAEKPKKSAPGRPERDSVKAGEAKVFPVNTALTPRRGDRHKPGYMAGYMRARRAAA